MVFSIQTQNGTLDIFKQDIAWEFKNIRFGGGLRDSFSTDIEIPKTNNNCNILGISGLLDSPTQLFGDNIQPCILEINGSTMDVYMQVVSINDDTISICLYEMTLPQKHRDTNISRIVKDDYTTIMAWNIDTIPAYPDWFKEYNYGMPYDPKYAQRHPIKRVNEIIDNVKNELGIDIPYVNNDWYAMATLKKVCPQNTRQSVEGVWSDGSFHIMGGQHITNDLSFSYDTTNNDRITFNRHCHVSIDLWISWQAKASNGYDIPFVVNHWKAATQTNETVEFRMRGDLYTNKVDRTTITFDVDLDDHISFGAVSANRFEMVRCLADMTITDYEINDDDYSNDLEYVGRLPRLVVYNYASGGYYYWYFDASQYDLAWHNRDEAGTRHQWLTTNWSSFAWYGYYCNLPEMKLGTFLYGLCWLLGKRITIENGTIQFEDVNKSTVLENASITDIKPYSENFGMKNYIRWENEEFPESVVDIDNEWLEPEHNLHVSPFGTIQNLSQFQGRVFQYENPKFEKGGDSESHHYSCDFKEIGYCIWWNVTSTGNITVISPYIRDIPLKTMGLDEITQTMTVTIESMDYDCDVDYVYLDGRKFMVVEGDTDLNTRETTLTALLVCNNEDDNKSKPTSQPIWKIVNENITNISCVQDNYGNTGMADVTRTATYEDINELSSSYKETRTVEETVRVENQTSCPMNTSPSWESQGETMTGYECISDEYGNTGECRKTYTTTYVDMNPRSESYGATRTETRTETVTDTTLCPESPAHDYFTITNEYNGNNTITLYSLYTGSEGPASYDIYYSKDGSTWSRIPVNTISGRTIELAQGESVMLKHRGTLGYKNPNNIIYFLNIKGSRAHSVSGNIRSLTRGDDYLDMYDNNGFPIGIGNYTFYRLFYDNTNLVSAKNLYLDGRLGDYCCSAMFYNCSSLVYAPELPSKELGTGSYISMFDKCVSLTEAPDLRHITSITANYPMSSMYSRCTNLSKVYAPTITWDTSKTLYWLDGVAASGTLYADSSIINSIPNNDASGCPSGWSKTAI